MKLRQSFASAGLVLLAGYLSFAFLIACTRKVQENTSLLSLSFQSRAMAITDVKHLIVSVQGPSMSPAIYYFDACPGGGDTCPNPMIPPSAVTLEVPKGKGRLIQVLYVLGSGGGSMGMYYGDSLKDLSLNQESVAIPTSAVGAVSNSHAEVFGKVCDGSTGPQTLSIAIPGKPPVPFRRQFTYSGFFEIGFPLDLPFSLYTSGRSLIENQMLQNFITPIANTRLVANPSSDYMVAQVFGSGCSPLTETNNEDAGHEDVGIMPNVRDNQTQLASYTSPFGNRSGPLDYFRVGWDASLKLAWEARPGTKSIKLFRKYSMSGGGEERFDCRNPNLDFSLVGQVPVSATGVTMTFDDVTAFSGGFNGSKIIYVGCALDWSDEPLPGYSIAYGCSSYGYGGCGGYY